MKVLKFGSKSLLNGTSLNNAIEVIKSSNNNYKVFVVLSARGNTISILKELLEQAVRGEDYMRSLDELIDYQLKPAPSCDFNKEYKDIKRILDGVSLLGEYTLKIQDRLLAYGDILSCKTVVSILKDEGVKSRFVDARELIKTDERYGGAIVDMETSRENVQAFFHSSTQDVVEIISGSIASSQNNNTTTLGKNGSNYSASLFANFIEASEVEDWTTVDGIYSADPWLVPNAGIIRNLSFEEANELANFGTEILHAKAIIPLIEKGISIRILNILKPEDKGTLINEGSGDFGIKAVTAIESVVLITVEGRGILGKVGIAGRLFTALSKVNVNIKLISLASSERDIDFVINAKDKDCAIQALEEEFASELKLMDLSGINVNEDVSIVSLIGKNFNFFDLAYSSLPKNNIHPYLLVNTINGENISMVISKRDLKKAVNVIHSQIKNVSKKMNVLVFGTGNMSVSFINYLIGLQEKLLEQRNISIKIVGVIHNGRALLISDGVGADWENYLELKGVSNYSFYDIYKFIYESNLANVVIVDNTDSKEIIEHYPEFIERRYDIVAANKNANITEYSLYKNLRYLLKENRKNFFYATNIGAGLPLITVLRIVKSSGDKVKKIRGVFSGTLSYIFNKFSDVDICFSDVLNEAIALGYAEQDPREDLSGYDIARKMIVLAREIGLAIDIDEAVLDNLIPDNLKECACIENFLKKDSEINYYFDEKKKMLKDGEVFRYIGEVSDEGILSAGLRVVAKDSILGELKGADLLFEVYTEFNGDTPMIIRGTGIGNEIIAREVFSDLLRLAEEI